MFKDKIKSLIVKKTEGNNKKTIENLVMFLVLLVVTIISINIIWGRDKNQQSEDLNDEYKVLAQAANESNISGTQEYNLEKELEDILSKISGVGKVQVLLTYSETSEVVAMHNEIKNVNKTEESDSNRWNKSN